MRHIRRAVLARLSALVLIPIAAFGFSRISRVQNWTQPLWLLLQFAPLPYLVQQGPAAVALWTGFAGGSHRFRIVEQRMRNAQTLAA